MGWSRMTYEQSIRETQWIKKYGFVADDKIFGIDRIKAALDKAIEATEKQIPKKPSGALTTSGISRYKSGVCKCGTAIVMAYKYCPSCGQAIDWEEK